MVATVDMSHVISSISWLRFRFFTSELFIAFRTAEAIALSDNIDEMNGIFPLIRGIRHKSCKMILLSHLLSDHRPWRILISKKALNQQLINWIYDEDIIYSFPLKGQLDFSTWRASLQVIRLYNFPQDKPYLESMKRREVERFDLRKESSTTRVVSFANALALAAFISNSSRLSKAKSMEASFYF